MDDFPKDSCVAVGGTLISVLLFKPNVHIPSRIDDMPIREIGQSALILSGSVRRVEVPDSVEALDNGFFDDVRGCQAIISIPGSAKTGGLWMKYVNRLEIRVCVDAQEKARLMATTFPLSDGERLICAETDRTGSIRALASLPVTFPKIYGDMLFTGEFDSDMFAYRHLLGSKPDTDKLEDDHIIEMIRDGKFGSGLPSDAEFQAEAAAVRKGDLIRGTEELAYAVMEPFIYNAGRWDTIIRIIKRMDVFFVTLVPVRAHGAQYYIHFRDYLAAKGITRVPVSVYGEDGLVTDTRLSEEIYAKYRLAALL